MPDGEDANATVPVGFVCRRCRGREFEVVWTRNRAAGKIVRCRACKGCGRRFVTVEREAFRAGPREIVTPVE